MIETRDKFDPYFYCISISRQKEEKKLRNEPPKIEFDDFVAAPFQISPANLVESGSEVRPSPISFLAL